MPPQLAAIICILFIIYLFWNDRKKVDGPSSALWIPFAWMFMAGSRYFTSWLNLGSQMKEVDAYTEGSAVDATIFALLIIAGVFVLLGRKIDWGQLLSRNKWIWLYLLYCGISAIWSDYPFVLFKRWIKELGNLIMVLVILTENRPYEAVGFILRRLAFLWLPLSVLFIRYYPEMGRVYSQAGDLQITGVAHQKNLLGQLCLISGIYFAWNFLINRKKYFSLLAHSNIIYAIFAVMIAWLLYISRSATSLVCMIVAVILFLISALGAMARKPDRIIIVGIVFGSLFLFLEATLDVSDIIVRLLGRDPDLTTRVPVWQVLKGMVVNPFIGEGYMSFWAGDRLAMIWERLGSTIIQAHNGYLEQYLNLGYIGVAFIVVIILSGLFKVKKYMHADYPSAILRLCFIVTAVLINYTEATFYGLSNIWLLLLIGVIEIPVAPQVHEEPITITQ